MVYFDITSGTNHRNRVVAVHSGLSAAATVSVVQCETMSPQTDTTNPGGGPDAAMSGTTANNFLRTTFATSSLITTPRAIATATTQPGGRYRVLAAVRRSSATGTIQVQASLAEATGVEIWRSSIVATLASTGRQIVDLGVAQWPPPYRVGSATVSAQCAAAVSLYAARDSGASTLDWDCLYLIPAGGQTDVVSSTLLLADSPDTYSTLRTRLVLDGDNDGAYLTTSLNDPTLSSVDLLPALAAGGAPQVVPNVANRLHVISWWRGGPSAPDAAVGSTVTVRAAYWPRYRFVRPVSS